MRPALYEMLAPAAIERLTLLINHVLGREPVAMERLKPHAGRVLLFRDGKVVSDTRQAPHDAARMLAER